VTAAEAATSAIDVDAVARSVAACPSVVSLSPGVFGEIATHLPGRRVNGVRVVDGVVEVHVVSHWMTSLPDAADDIRAAVVGVVGARRVNVFIDDLSANDDLAEPGDGSIQAGA
jgi:hypothetical protein